MSQFPSVRPRRLRRTDTIRRMVRETVLRADDFVYPMFVKAGQGLREPIPSMPGQFRLSPDEAVALAREAWALGVPAVLLFGIPEEKDAVGSAAADPDEAVQRTVRALKGALPDLCVMTDVCLCEYTDHGHCGVLGRAPGAAADAPPEVLNDPSLERLAEAALSHARAGADVVAPSDMMDGRVGHIRRALDDEGYDHVAILSYAAKYASAFYGPFREAAGSTPRQGDRRGYQMDPGNAREALREVALDVGEGADMVMVKPALPYLDVLARVRATVDLPVAAYHVSGEYAMLEAAARAGWLDRERAILETLTSIRRAGADLVLTYHALDAARLLATA
ncbi:MAG TPA: porphobilinogen synthase [Myxococcota bacterium]|jgi:porphobilinogen synthase|nr:porphobilinogen synthase [Myxococcota bacterium]